MLEMRHKPCAFVHQGEHLLGQVHLREISVRWGKKGEADDMVYHETSALLEVGDHQSWYILDRSEHRDITTTSYKTHCSSGFDRHMLGFKQANRFCELRI
jgi:hypothetical protein